MPHSATYRADGIEQQYPEQRRHTEHEEIEPIAHSLAPSTENG